MRQLLAALMQALQGKKAPVHSQFNMRASRMTFRYRLVTKKQASEGPWRQLMLATPQQDGIGLDPFWLSPR